MKHQHKSTTTAERIYHVREPSTHGSRRYSGGTVFFRAVPELIPGTTHWRVGVSRCDVRDQFSRERGRTTAKRRALQPQHYGGNPFPFPLPADEKPDYELARLFYVSEDDTNHGVIKHKHLHLKAKA